MDRTVMNYLLDSLAEAGLVERRPDPADRRARRIVATPRGQALLDELGRRLREAEDHVLAGLDETADRRAFRTLLQRLSLHAATALESISGVGTGVIRGTRTRALPAARPRSS